MMKERRLSREVAMQLLYQWESQGLFEKKVTEAPKFIHDINIDNYLGHFLYNFYAKDKRAIDTPFVSQIVKGTIANLDTIDASIDTISNKWKISRMDSIDRALLRIACYELIIKAELSARVIINEAVELAKRYGGENSPAFVNGILDAIKEKEKI